MLVSSDPSSSYSLSFRLGDRLAVVDTIEPAGEARPLLPSVGVADCAREGGGIREAGGRIDVFIFFARWPERLKPAISAARVVVKAK